MILPVSHYIKKALKFRNLNYQELADKINISHSQLSCIMRNKRGLTLSNAYRIEQALQISEITTYFLMNKQLEYNIYKFKSENGYR